MPRRTITKCSRRGRAHSIEMPVEFHLCHGHVFGCSIWEIATYREFAQHWQSWRDEITRRWVEGYPGSRPMAAYLCGEIEPPGWRRELPALRSPVRTLEGCSVRIEDMGWHRWIPEFEHLDRLGLLTAAERRAALARIRGRDPVAPSLYRSIADEADAGLRPPAADAAGDDAGGEE